MIIRFITLMANRAGAARGLRLLLRYLSKAPAFAMCPHFWPPLVARFHVISEVGHVVRKLSGVDMETIEERLALIGR